MAWYSFWKQEKKTASVAIDRLKIIVARERTACADGTVPGYLPQLQQELLQVIAKYERVDLDHVNVNIDKRGDSEVLELSIMLPDSSEPRADGGRRVAFA